jgi:hypothetical protein
MKVVTHIVGRAGQRHKYAAQEIVIEAKDRAFAQRALNLVTAAKMLLDDDFTTSEFWTALPEENANLEDLSEREYRAALQRSAATFGYGRAAAIAAKTTHRRRWTSSLVKYWLSLQSCSVPAMEHHPRYEYKFTIERDPFSYGLMAQALIPAYSSIEELALEVRASNKNPSKIDGAWNPPVLADLRRRLLKAGINLDDTFVWHLRTPPSRIEKGHPPPTGQRASWSGRSIRDRLVRVEDALNYASFLRSKVSAHATNKLTRSLTMNDLYNVQNLARRLLLETLGWWNRYPS